MNDLRSFKCETYVVFFLCILLLLAHFGVTATTARQQTSTPREAATMTAAQLEELLSTAGDLAKNYTTLFKDLTTQETKTVQLYDKGGKLTRERRIVSELVVYQPPRDATKTTEYRNVLEVDGKPVSERQERLEKVFERAAKSNSVDKELDRIRRDGTRYDFGYNLTGYTIYKGIALWKGVRQSFKFEVVRTRAD